MGSCPCPRCTIPKTRIPEVGTVNDEKNRITRERIDNERQQSKILLARQWIYNLGYNIRSQRVENLLFPESLVPTKVRDTLYTVDCLFNILCVRICSPNAFISLVSTTFRCLCPTSCTSLNSGHSRLCSSISCAYLLPMADQQSQLSTHGKAVHLSLSNILIHNCSYCMVPTFGAATIRRFVSNASAMKKMAARNFEDLLRVRLLYLFVCI